MSEILTESKERLNFGLSKDKGFSAIYNMNIRLQVKQWGNSKAIRLPKDFTNTMNLNMGDFLEPEKN